MSSAKRKLIVDLAAWLLAGSPLLASPSAAILVSTTVSSMVLAGSAEAQVDDDEDDDDNDDEDEIDDDDILDDEDDIDDEDIADESDDDFADDGGDEDVDDVEDDTDEDDIDDGADDTGDDVEDGGDEDEDAAEEEDDDDGGGDGDDDGDDDEDDSPGGNAESDDDDGGDGDDDGDDDEDDGPSGNAENDDDDDTGDNSGDDEDGSEAGGSKSGDDEDDDDRPSSGGRPGDDDDGPGGAGVRGVSPSSGSSPKDPDERPDTRSASSDILVDDEGYPLADKELLTFDLGPTDLSILEEIGFRLVEQTRLDGIGTSLQRLRPPSGMSMPDAVDALRDAQPAAPFDYNHVFGLPASDQLEDEGRKVQKVGGVRSGEGAVVAMIDTLVDPKHPSLSTRKIVVKDFASSKKGRDSDHATAVASIIVGFDPEADYRGIVPGAKLIAANVFSVSKDGVPETDTKALLQALDWAASQGAGVINFSIAGPPSDILEAAVKRLSEKGHIITAAVGNDGPAAPPVFPATYSNVVGVTAVDIDGKIYRRAGRGAQVDIAAPGVKILAAGPNGSYSAVTGTSFATPVVSALLSLENPTPGKDASKRAEAFTQEARDLGASGADPTFGYGLVQIEIEEVN